MYSNSANTREISLCVSSSAVTINFYTCYTKKPRTKLGKKLEKVKSKKRKEKKWREMCSSTTLGKKIVSFYRKKELQFEALPPTTTFSGRESK